MGAAGAAIMSAIAKHGEEQAAKDSAIEAEIEQIEDGAVAGLAVPG